MEKKKNYTKIYNFDYKISISENQIGHIINIYTCNRKIHE